MKTIDPPTPREETDLARPLVLGTAGHVDHGKSTLVQALTGIDPDRLAEEKARSMTIDLGFAWFTLPSGRDVSVIDVPGHERFIKNMLAGVGGIDAALLVIAADEGPMPQTNEHLAILDVLDVRQGVVAVTKVDAVDDDWLDLVTEEICERLTGTTLADAPLVPVSAITGSGLPELTTVLDATLAEVAIHAEHRPPRLPVDRVFTISGFGTVVTGTLLDGVLTTGQELTIYPSGRRVRVRGLQTHQQDVEQAGPGSRVAVNLSGVAVEDVRRGDVLAPAGALTASLRLDVQLRLLDTAPKALEQNNELILFAGAAEVPCRVTLLDRETLEPGATGWVQLRLRDPLAVRPGDRFIVRRPSPGDTVGGGIVVDATPVRHKRFQEDVLNALDVLAQGDPVDIVLQSVAVEPRTTDDLKEHLSLPGDRTAGAVHELVTSDRVMVLGAKAPPEPQPRHYLLATTTWEQIVDRLRTFVERFHARYPLRAGIPKEELRQHLGYPAGRLYDEVLATAERERVVEVHGQTVGAAGYRISLDPERRASADCFLAAARSMPWSPPGPNEFGLDADGVNALVQLGEAVRVTDGVVYPADVFAAIQQRVADLIERDGELTLAGYRDAFGTSRKYAQATLEYLDQIRFTRRSGDARTLVRRPT